MHWTLPRLIGITILLTAYSCSEGGKSSTPVSGSDALGPDVSDPGWPDANDDRDTFAPGPLACPEHSDPQLETTLGCIRGTTNIVGEVFLGIPFAEPPVGDLRWRRPTPPEPWSAPFDATQLGPLCVQAMDGVFGESFLGEGEEDCLQLNIYRPQGAQNLPILFFSHGGGLASGGAVLDVYADNPRLAENAVLVTYQYRLGPLGFLAHPALTAEDAASTSGNLGVLDALMALQFVHDNAEAIGGDPDHLLIFGESAGGLMTHALLASPLARDLYTAAIIQSSTGTRMNTPIASEESFGLELQEALGCGDIECMRDLPAKEIAQAAPGAAGLDFLHHRYVINVDGHVLPKPYYTLLKEGSLPDVPVIIGLTGDESKPFTTVPGGAPTTLVALDNWIRAQGALLGVDDLDGLVSFYTANRFNDSPQEAYEAFYADAFVHCPVRRWAEVASALLDVRTYVWTRHIDAVQDLKAFHGVELSFVFGTLFDELHTPAEEAMSAYVRDTWTSAAMGAPTVKEMEWPLYDPPTAKWMILDLVPEVETHLRLEICEFLLAEGWPPY